MRRHSQIFMLLSSLPGATSVLTVNTLARVSVQRDSRGGAFRSHEQELDLSTGRIVTNSRICRCVRVPSKNEAARNRGYSLAAAL